MSAEALLTDEEWARITAVCQGMPNEARPLITSFISVYRQLPEYKKLKRLYDEAARLAQKTAELTERIERYRNDASAQESLCPTWQKSVGGLDELVGVLTLWTERFQETKKMGKIEVKVSRDAVKTLLGYIHVMVWKLDRSKEVERLVATVLEIADDGVEKKKETKEKKKKKMKKKNIGWQIRTAIDERRRLEQKRESDDEYFKNLASDPRFQESMKRLIPDLDTQKK
jgi:hypothetical protein